MKTILSFSLTFIFLLSPQLSSGADLADLRKAKLKRGIVLVTGKITPDVDRQMVDLAKNTELTIYFQSPDAAMVLTVRKAADAAGLLGERIFVEQSRLDRICLGDNVADAAFVRGATEKELLRVLRPGARRS